LNFWIMVMYYESAKMGIMLLNAIPPNPEYYRCGYSSVKPGFKMLLFSQQSRTTFLCH
jgi:hypothetical protein